MPRKKRPPDEAWQPRTEAEKEEAFAVLFRIAQEIERQQRAKRLPLVEELLRNLEEADEPGGKK